MQFGPLDRDVLDRDAVALADPGSVEDGEGRDRDREEQDRDQAEQPGRPGTVPAVGACRLRLDQETSKNPAQPSSVNSVTWAWNMNRPGFGKRISSIPRWPWPWITVSVSSEDSSDVPVG